MGITAMVKPRVDVHALKTKIYLQQMATYPVMIHDSSVMHSFRITDRDMISFKKFPSCLSLCISHLNVFTVAGPWCVFFYCPLKWKTPEIVGTGETLYIFWYMKQDAVKCNLTKLTTKRSWYLSSGQRFAVGRAGSVPPSVAACFSVAYRSGL